MYEWVTFLEDKSGVLESHDQPALNKCIPKSKMHLYMCLRIKMSHMTN